MDWRVKLWLEIREEGGHTSENQGVGGISETGVRKIPSVVSPPVSLRFLCWLTIPDVYTAWSNSYVYYIWHRFLGYTLWHTFITFPDRLKAYIDDCFVQNNQVYDVQGSTNFTRWLKEHSTYMCTTYVFTCTLQQLLFLKLHCQNTPRVHINCSDSFYIAPTYIPHMFFFNAIPFHLIFLPHHVIPFEWLLSTNC